MDKHQKFLNNDLKVFIDKCVGILQIELENQKKDPYFNENKTQSYATTFSSLKTEKQKLSFFKLYGNKIRKDKEESNRIKIQSKSNHIYLLALFERYRKNLLNHSYNYSKKHKDTYRKWMGQQAHKDNDIDLLLKITKSPDDLLSHTDKISGKIFEIEKRMFGLKDLDGNHFIKESLSNYIICREIRNLLVHRSDKTDDKLYSSLRHGLSGTIGKSNKNISKILNYKGFSNLKKLPIDEEIKVDSLTIIILFFDIIFLSFFMTSNALTKKQSPDISKYLGEFINDTMCLFLSDKISVMLKKFVITFLDKYVTNLIKSTKTNVEYNSDILLVNHAILLKNKKKVIGNISELTNGVNKKSYFSEMKKQKSSLDRKIKELINDIKHKKTKNIISSYIKDNDLELIMAINEFGTENTNLLDWSLIVDKLKESDQVRKYLIIEENQKSKKFRKSLFED